MQLNASQREVVATRDSRILVLAGAGTGKTATSVHWVAEIIREGAPRSSVLMITFTRKAAHEMSRRVERLLAGLPPQDPQDRLAVGTYHAIASILLRSDAEGFGLPNRNFSTLDESEAQSIWKSALKQCGHNAKSALHVPGRLHGLYSLARNTCQPVRTVMADFFGEARVGEVLAVVDHYEDLKRAANVVDYDDLLTIWADRLEKDEAYAGRLRERFRYVLVDEMQDNNQLNQRILDGLNPGHLLVVGDANQSIYGFRGSDVSLIVEFPRRHPGAKILKLENNYRSGQSILDLANQVVSRSAAALHLQSARHGNFGHGAVSYRMYLTPEDEAKGVIGWIRDRVTAGVKPTEVAILARGSKVMTALEVQLNVFKIPYKKYGGLTLADAAEVKDFIAFLRVAHNPQDKIALLRALTQFPGIGEGTAVKAIAARGEGLFSEDIWPKSAAAMATWTRELRGGASLGKAGRYLQGEIRPLILQNYPRDGEDRLGTINALVNSMEQTRATLTEFLDGFSIDRTTDNRHPDDAVTLSTVHSAKGLEWDSVWLAGAGSTTMPHPRAETRDEIDEERRLFYVAVTRAKQNLVISYPAMNERKQNQSYTMFIPDGVEWSFCRPPEAL
ncbi:MAG: ATP-dependent helicase [Verrucomicrobiota bacterium]